MLFMIVEHYTVGAAAVYERVAIHGRMLPEGLDYIESWVVDDESLDRCFQLMATDDPSLFEIWIEHWHDLVEFQVFPVVHSATAATRTLE